VGKFSGKDLVTLAGGLILGGSIGLVVLLGIDNHFLNRLVNYLKLANETRVGAKAPDFELDELTGNQFSFSMNAGKIIVLNFWATWCAPCRYEMPLFERYSKTYPDELAVLAVNMQESESDIQKFTNELGLTFPILLDSDGLVSRLYRVQGLPTTYFIDPEGRISFIHIGTISETQIEDYLMKIGLIND
jgi:thiol-disulfide isomerase/thioredoxin